MFFIISEELFTHKHISVSTTSSFSSSSFSITSIFSFLTSSIISSFISSTLSSIVSSFPSVGSSLFSFSLLFFPLFFSQEIFSFSLNWGLITSSFLLISCRLFGKCNFDNSQKSLLLHSDESFFSWFININNFSFFDFSDLVKSRNSSFDNLSNP